MKIKDLIAKLQKFDPETTVVVGGFDEEGYADINRIQLVQVVPRKSQIDILGEYEASKLENEEAGVKVLLVDH